MINETFKCVVFVFKGLNSRLPKHSKNAWTYNCDLTV